MSRLSTGNVLPAMCSDLAIHENRHAERGIELISETQSEVRTLEEKIHVE
jgi:hypothetical protein